jgi:predicted alpha-1,6-mannanase (GH76 family)
MLHKTILTFIVAIMSLSGYAQRQGDLRYLYRGDTIIRALHRIERSDHLWQHTGWWNSANIFEAMLDHQLLIGTRDSAWCRRLYQANITRYQGGYINDYYDDNAWWALAWIKAYDLYHDQDYLHTAGRIWHDMDSTGRDTICSGGMAWHRARRYKNAITNELYIVLSARLAQRETDVTLRQVYITAAQQNWLWLSHSGMIDKDHLIHDGLAPDCRSNGGTTWTYNQGVILGGLADLSALTGDTALLGTARSIAYSAIAALSDSARILTEPGSDRKIDDLAQFKGIFVRYLAQLNSVLRDPQISQYIRRNADTAWTHA